MNKLRIAFLPGLLSFLLLTFVGETVGLPAAFASLAVYFFVCQFPWSRGNPDALRRDWRLMPTLDAALLVSVVTMAVVERRDVILTQGIGILLSCCGGTFAGALVASRSARRAAQTT